MFNRLFISYLVVLFFICRTAKVQATLRVLKDDGSFAMGFGGPVAQSAMQENSNTEGNPVPTSLPVDNGQNNVITKVPTSRPVDNSQNVEQSKPATATEASKPPGIRPDILKCTFEQKPMKILTVVAFNLRRRREIVTSTNQTLNGISATNVSTPWVLKSTPATDFQNVSVNTKVLVSLDAVDRANKGFQSKLFDSSDRTNRTSENQILLLSLVCDTVDVCIKKCQELPCNYFIRSTYNSASNLYEVSPDKLSQGNYSMSITFDSYIKVCGLQKEQQSFQTKQMSIQDVYIVTTLPPNPQTIQTAQPQAPYGSSTAHPITQSVPSYPVISSVQSYAQPSSPSYPVPPAVPSYSITIPTQAPPTIGYQPTEPPKCIHIIPDDMAQMEFRYFMLTFFKSYETYEERESRYQTFKDNMQIIQQMNCEHREEGQGTLYELGEFSDMSYEEFIMFSGGALAPIGEVPKINPQVGLRGKKVIEKCPKFDWSEMGVIPSPRKQGRCGACYAFSTSDLIASQYQIDRKLFNQSTMLTLSPQYILDCMKTPVALGCNGGRPIEVLRNLTVCTDPEGCNMPTDECYAYQSKKGKCKHDECQKTPKIPVRWATINDLTGELEKESIAALLQWGPAVVIINADQSWQFYNGKGILREKQCGKKQNHAVLLVGYDYTGPVPYYIIKNSWGTKWGAKGFIKLEAGKNTCSVAKTLTFCCTRNCGNIKDTTDLARRPNSEGCEVKIDEPATYSGRDIRH